jgi:putative ABC transport system ATP-binding protein
MTAEENVKVPMAFAGVTPDEARERAMDLLELVGLKERWFHKPIEMSGGQQQRVAIARSLANLPSILLCDEPTANLDLDTGAEILEILSKLNKERGVTVICATHDFRVLNQCDRMMWIRDGQVDQLKERGVAKVELSSITAKAQSNE